LSKLFCQDQDQDFIFCPRGASRPRLWSRGLHHWLLMIVHMIYQPITMHFVPFRRCISL